MSEEKAEEEATPEERLAKAAASKRFSYVCIPADGGDCKELSGATGAGDMLPDILRPCFAAGDVSDEVIAAHAARSGQQISIANLRAVLARGGAETVPMDCNGRETVYAYLDEASGLKGLPRNDRATALARACGLTASFDFLGDIYIGRQSYKEGGLVENVDFRLAEIEHRSPWVRRAVFENSTFQQMTQPEEHAAAQLSSNGPASGQAEGYSWKDDGADVEISVVVDKGTAKKDIKVEFRQKEVRVLKPVAHTFKLHAAVDVDGCSWTISDGALLLTMEKGSVGAWPKLLA